MKLKPLPTPHTQRGVTTMTVTLILVLLTGLAMAYTSRNAINELRLSANEVREKQAFAAANAGIEHALAYMSRPGGVDQDKNNVVDAIAANTLNAGGTNPSYYQATYCSNTVDVNALACPAQRTMAIACTAPANFTNVIGFSCGWSDDNTSVRKVTQVFKNSPSLGGTISTPLISKGTTNLLTGGASVLNYYNDLTVWTGQSILGQSNTGKTFINATGVVDPAFVPNPVTNNSPACNNPPAGYACSTQGANIGHDTITGDTRLSTLTNNQFFELFFGDSPTNYRNNVATHVVDLNNTLTMSNEVTFGSLDGTKGATIWIEGNSSVLPTLGAAGGNGKGVIVIVNGDLELGSNTEIHGLVFVMGNASGSGNPKIYGSLIVAGTSAFNGNLLVVYDPNVMSDVESVGKVGKVPGTWRDW